jgi:hypothetical protein
MLNGERVTGASHSRQNPVSLLYRALQSGCTKYIEV